MFVSPDASLPENDRTDVNKYINTACALFGGPCRASMCLVESVVEKLICGTGRDRCLPWILSSSVRTQKWIHRFDENNDTACRNRYLAVAFEKACEANNEIALHHIFQYDHLSQENVRNLLQKASKCGNFTFVTTLLNKYHYDDVDVYNAFYFALPRGHLSLCDELLHRFPDMERFWSYKLFLEIDDEDETSRRYYTEHYRGIYHLSDTVKKMSANGCWLQYTLDSPLPESMCHERQQHFSSSPLFRSTDIVSI